MSVAHIIYDLATGHIRKLIKASDSQAAVNQAADGQGSLSFDDDGSFENFDINGLKVGLATRTIVPKDGA